MPLCSAPPPAYPSLAPNEAAWVDNGLESDRLVARADHGACRNAVAVVEVAVAMDDP